MYPGVILEEEAEKHESAIKTGIFKGHGKLIRGYKNPKPDTTPTTPFLDREWNVKSKRIGQFPSGEYPTIREVRSSLPSEPTQQRVRYSKGQSHL